MTTVASLFDGIGGTPLAARLSGAECLWCSEIEKFPQMITKHHFPSMKHYGDITKINGAEVEPVDIIVGGSPCQDLSVAGKRQGMKHSDFGDEETTRSGLFMEQIRIVKEMRDATATNQPRFMVWENVPGAFSSNKGEDFRAVLEETAKIKDETISIPRPVGGKWANAGCIMGDGFSIAWRTVDAQYWGVAQRRRRIYLVADFGGQSAPEILFEQPRGDRHIAESGNEGQGAAGDVERSVGEAVYVLNDQVGQRQLGIATYSFQRSDELKKSEVACTQSARQYKSATDLVSAAGQVRRLTPLECERLQGYPDRWTDIPGANDTTRYKALGNSFAMPNILFVMQRCVEVTRCAV